MRARPVPSVVFCARAAGSLACSPVLDATPLAEGCRTVDVADTPEDPTDDVRLCEQQLFVRAGDAPLSNAASAVFSTQAPSAAPVGGAGLGSSVVDIAAQGDPAHGLEVTGTFTGAVDTIDVEAWVLMPNGASGSHDGAHLYDGTDVPSNVVPNALD